MNAKCNWCGKYLDNNFSVYCSKKCEKEAVESGEPNGVEIIKDKIKVYLGGFFFIFIVSFIYKCNKDNADTFADTSANTSTEMNTVPNIDSVSQKNIEPNQSNESVNDNLDEQGIVEIEEPPTYIEKGSAYCNIDKSYFYNDSDYSTITNSYIINGDNIDYYVIDASSDFIYVIYTNKDSGKKVNGWMLKQNFAF